LDDGRVEHETFYAEGKVQVVIEVSDAHELFLLEWLNKVPVNLLFEFSHIFFLMFKHFFQLRIVTSFPICLPRERQKIHFRDDFLMDIPEVKNVSAVFRNVLDVTHHMMLGPASEFKIFGHLNYAYIRILWLLLVFFHAMNPNVNVCIRLLDWITSQLNAIFFTLLPFEFSTLLTESFLVLSCSHLEGLATMICIVINGLPTHAPVSPSYTHPWNGH
jgi:hypothetical protein